MKKSAFLVLSFFCFFSDLLKVRSMSVIEVHISVLKIRTLRS